MNEPIRVAVTGAAGNISYSLLFRLASGNCFGPDQPLILQLLEIPPAMKALEGVVMELTDAAFPLLVGIETADDANKAFAGAHAAFLVGGKPRGPGMERADLIKENGPIFTGQGKALNDHADRDVKVLVVGNPCNTNCLIAKHAAPELPPENFTAMTRLDENRAKGQISRKLGLTSPGEVKRMAVWGNHSNTMFPDYFHAQAAGKAVTDHLDASWLEGDFLQTVATRGKAIINARGASSAASAASAAVDHMRDWWHGTADGDFTSMAIASQGHYDVPEGIIYSFPVTVKDRKWQVVEGLEHNDFAKGKLKATADELLEERSAVAELLG